jgi:hypothetical protein
MDSRDDINGLDRFKKVFGFETCVADCADSLEFRGDSLVVLGCFLELLAKSYLWGRRRGGRG